MFIVVCIHGGNESTPLSITRNKYLLSCGMGKEREKERKRERRKKERGIIRPGAISPGAVNYLK